MFHHASKITAIIALAFSSVVLADNTITFKGEVTGQTCQVSVDGQGSSVILLPAVSSSSLTSQGAVANPTTFTIGLSGCTQSEDEGSFGLKIVSNYAQNDILTNNAVANAASNVGFQLQSAAGIPIPVSNTGSVISKVFTLSPGSTSATANFQVAYYALGAATPGQVESSMQYAISYQ